MDDVESIADYAVESLRDAMTQLGQDMVEDIQQDLSTPYPPASLPGESPHLRAGALRDGVASETTVEGDIVETVVSSSRVEGNPLVPLYLNLGTRKMSPRPYMFSAASRWAMRVAPRIVIQLRS